MRLLAVTLALVLFAAVCSLSVPRSVGPRPAPMLASAQVGSALWDADVDPSSERSATPGREDGDVPADDVPVGDDLDDDGELLGMLRAGSTVAPLEAALVRWEARVDGLVFGHAPPDPIRPPIRA